MKSHTMLYYIVLFLPMFFGGEIMGHVTPQPVVCALSPVLFMLREQALARRATRTTDPNTQVLNSLIEPSLVVSEEPVFDPVGEPVVNTVIGPLVPVVPLDPAYLD